MAGRVFIGQIESIMKFTPQLDLVLTPERRQAIGYLKGLAVALFLLLFLAIYAWQYQTLSARLASLETQKTMRLQASTRVPKVNDSEQKKIGAIRTMTNQLLTPWESLLTAVEQSWSSPLTIVSLSTNSDATTLLITVSAPKFQNIHEFVQVLSEQKMLRYVQLQSEMTQDRKTSEWQAVVQAHWVE